MSRPCYRSSVSDLISTQNEGDLNFGRINAQLTVSVRSRTGRSPRRPRTSHTAAALIPAQNGPAATSEAPSPRTSRSLARVTAAVFRRATPAGLADDDRWQIGAPGTDAHSLSSKPLSEVRRTLLKTCNRREVRFDD